jgi:hypothetical protein
MNSTQCRILYIVAMNADTVCLNGGHLHTPLTTGYKNMKLYIENNKNNIKNFGKALLL